MKVKTSVTLTAELLQAIAEEVEQQNRSAFIEEAAWSLLHARARVTRDQRDLAAINAHADALNREARDVLEYQDIP